MTLSASQQHDLARGLELASTTVLANLLKYEGLAVGTHAKDALVDRIYAYLQSGDLDDEELLLTVRGIEENRNKRVYCFRVAMSDLGTIPAALPHAATDLLHARIRAGVAGGHLSYSFRDGGQIKLCFTETQTDIRRVPHSLTLEPVEVTNLILAQIDLQDGWLSISYDPPSSVHAHGNSRAYYRAYQERVESILGVSFTAVDLTDVLEGLQTSPLVIERNTKVDTGDGFVHLVGSGVDCRSMNAAPGVRTYTQARDKGHYEWLPQDQVAAQAGIFGVYSGTVPLLRSVPTDIHALPGMIRFSRDCLPLEVDYVMERVREFL